MGRCSIAGTAVSRDWYSTCSGANRRSPSRTTSRTSSATRRITPFRRTASGAVYPTWRSRFARIWCARKRDRRNGRGGSRGRFGLPKRHWFARPVRLILESHHRAAGDTVAGLHPRRASAQVMLVLHHVLIGLALVGRRVGRIRLRVGRSHVLVGVGALGHNDRPVDVAAGRGGEAAAPEVVERGGAALGILDERVHGAVVGVVAAGLVREGGAFAARILDALAADLPQSFLQRRRIGRAGDR